MAPEFQIGRRGYAVLSDLDLALRAARADHDAFAELVHRAAPAVQRLLRRMGAQPAQADDVVQDALLAALQNIASYRAEARFASWVMRIAARLYVKRRRQDASLLLSAEPQDFANLNLSDTTGVAEQLDLDRALALLTPPEQLCVSLCHGAGFTHSEIAGHLDLPLGTVKSHVSRGLRKLRRHMLGADSEQLEQDT